MNTSSKETKQAKTSKEIVFQWIQDYPALFLNLSQVFSSIQCDEEIAFKACQVNINNFEFCPKDIRSSKEFILKVIEDKIVNYDTSESWFSYSAKQHIHLFTGKVAMEFRDTKVMDDNEVCLNLLKLMKRYGIRPVADGFSTRILNDLSFFKEAVDIAPSIFSECGENIRGNIEMATKVISNDYTFFNFSAKILKEPSVLFKNIYHENIMTAFVIASKSFNKISSEDKAWMKEHIIQTKGFYLEQFVKAENYQEPTSDTEFLDFKKKRKEVLSFIVQHLDENELRLLKPVTEDGKEIIRDNLHKLNVGKIDPSLNKGKKSNRSRKVKLT